VRASPAPAPSPSAAGGPPFAALLVRHAETEWTLSGRHTGRTDLPLTEAGREAARRMAPRLAAWRFGLVLVSPSRRARETCELCGLGARAQVDENLLEWDYGDYEGLTTKEILERSPDWVLWRDGCPGGELPDQVGVRADRVISSLSTGPAPAAIFAHGHILRVLGARWISLEAGGGGRLALSTGGLCTLGYEHGRAVISSWNDTGDRHGGP
jgi:broad specificity phosphatase PhoE